MLATNLKLLGVFLLGIGGCYAQQSVVSAGGNATGSGGTAAFTVAQTVYTTNVGTGSLSQGVQQPYEVTTLGVDDFPEISLKMRAYPNPAADVLTISVEDIETANMSFQMVDINGRILESRKIDGNQTNINMNDKITGIYLVNILDGNKQIKAFKIIKK